MNKLILFGLCILFLLGLGMWISASGTLGTPVKVGITQEKVAMLGNYRAICRDGQGNIHMAWQYKDQKTVTYANSSDDGITWTSKNITDSAFIGIKKPSIACDGNNIYIAHTNDTGLEIFVFNSSDNGGTFTKNVALPLSENINVYKMTPIQANGSKVYVSYIFQWGGVSSVGFINSSDGGTTWSSPRTVMNITDGSGCEQFGHLGMIVDWGSDSTEDKIHLIADCYTTPYKELYYSNSSNSEKDFSTPIIIIGAGLGHSSITYNGSNVYAVTQNESDTSIWFASSTDYGATWITAYQIDPDVSDVYYGEPVLSLTNESYPIVIFEHNTSNANYDIGYIKYNGTDWEPMQNITDNNYGNYYPNTKYKFDNNRVEFFWVNGTSVPYDILYNYIEYGIDTTAPVITNLSNHTTTNSSTYITWNTDENANYTFKLYNVSDRTIEVATANNSNYLSTRTLNITNLLNFTTYWINLTVCDSSGNCAENNTFNFTTLANDITSPKSNITSNNTSPKINDVVNISMNVSDIIGLSHCWFYNNISKVNSSLISLSGTSEHSLCYNITTINVTHTNVLFRGYVNDTSNNLNWSDIIITVANTAPNQPTISFPIDGKNYSDTELDINFTATDDDGDALTFTLYINNTINVTTSTNVTDWNASDGFYNLTVTASDGTNSSINSSVVNFRLDTTEPSFSNNKTNASSTTYNGTVVQLNLTITDNGAGIDFYRLTTNDTSDGIWINETLIDIDGNSVTAIFNYSIHNFTIDGGTLGWRVWANDTLGQVNISQIYTLVVQAIPDTTFPTYSNWQNNASSTTYQNTDVNFSIDMADDRGLDSFFFAHNQSGTMINVTNGTMGSTTSFFFNYSLTVTLTASNYICAEMSFNDTSGNINLTSHSCFTVQDTTPPTYSNFQNNASTLTKINGIVNWSIDFADNIGLSFYIFAHNQSGTLTNITNGTLSGTSAFVNKTITITKAQGNYICGQYWFNDSSNNINQTNLSCFTVIDTLPTTPTSDSLTPNSPVITEELTGACSGSTDADSDTITYHCRFYDITDSNERQAFSSDCTYQLSSPEDLSDQFRVDCRATTSLGNSADRTGTDLETVRTASIYEINTFSDGTSRGNMTFLSSVYKNISIPNWAIVTKAELDLTGYDFNCYQETANVSTSCGGLSTGKYSYQNNYFYINLSISSLASTDSKWLVKHGNLSKYNASINSSCFINNLLQFRVYSSSSVTPDRGISYGQCYDGSSWINTTNVSVGGIGFGTSSAHVPPENLWDGDWNTNASYRDDTPTGWKVPTATNPNTYETYSMIFEEGVWLLTGYPTNVTIRTNNEITYQNLSIFSGTVTDIDLNISSLNDCIYACDNPNGTECLCEINFTSATTGILEYSNIEIEYGLGIDNCTNYNISSLNVFLLNESTNTSLNGTMEFVFNFNLSNHFSNYSTSVEGENASFCILRSVTTNVLINYVIAGTTYEYNLFDFDMTNITQILYLYSQDATTRITFTVTDLFDDPIEEAYIKILKYDVGDNLYKTVEILKTNNDGEAIGNIVLYTEWYRFIVEYNGIIYLTTEPSKIFSTTKVFRIDLTAEDWFANYDTVLGVATELNFTNSTLNFRYTWNDPTGAMHYGCLQVVKINRTVEKTICDSCTLSTAATILCNIGANPQGRYIAQGYLKFDTLYMTDILEKVFGGGDWVPLYEKDGGIHKEFGVFLSFMLILGLTMIGIWNPVTAITMLLVGFFIASTLGFIKLQVTALITLIILGIIVIYKISKK